MTTPKLQILRCSMRAWPHVAMCLTIRDSQDNPSMEIVPIPIGNNMYTLIVGGTVIFDIKEWKALQVSSNISIEPIPPLA